MKIQLPLLVAALLTTLTQASPVADQISLSSVKEKCDCNGTIDGGKASAAYICRDSRLGPKQLPKKLALSTLLSDYDRLGGLTPGAFLSKWTDSKGNYVYPPQDGFVLDVNGSPIQGNMTLQIGAMVDRFGSEYGSYVSAADAPYSQRALPPSNLDTNPSAPDYPYNYHVYKVIKPLTVLGGPIAPWFGQPGLGAQFYTGATGNIMTLVAGGYLERLNTSSLTPGNKGC